MAEELQRHGIKFTLDLNKHPKDATNLSLINAENFKVSEDGSTLISDKTLKVNTVIKNKLSEYYRDNLYNIIFCIPTNEEIVLFVVSNYTENKYYDLDLFRYNEQLDICSDSIIPSEYEKMKYYGGKFSGTFTYNVKNELIIAFCEYDSIYSTYLNYGEPLKTINLGYFDINKEGNYYLNIDSNLNPKTFPLCPEVDIPNIINWKIIKGLSKKGWYNFYIRYKINKYDYTQWFSFGRAFYLDESENKTIFKYLATNETSGLTTNEIWKVESDISNSIDLCNKTINFTLNNLSNIYDEYQIGFICNTKTYTECKITNDIKISNTNFILNYKNTKNYDYNNLLKTYENYYSVKNIINYNNRLYLSNYNSSKKINIKNNIDFGIWDNNKDNINVLSDDNKRNILISFNGEEKTIELEDNKITISKLLGVDKVYSYLNKSNSSKIYDAILSDDNNFYFDAYSILRNLYRIIESNGETTPITKINKCSGYGGWTLEWYNTIEKNSTIMNGEFSKIIEEHWIKYYSIDYEQYDNVIDISNYKFSFDPSTNVLKCEDLDLETKIIVPKILSSDKIPVPYFEARYYYNIDIIDYPNIKQEYKVLSEPDIAFDDVNYKFSLIPKQPYNFFIHYIDKYGFINDGLPITTSNVVYSQPVIEINDKFYMLYCMCHSNASEHRTNVYIYFDINVIPPTINGTYNITNLTIDNLKNAIFYVPQINGNAVNEYKTLDDLYQYEIIIDNEGNKSYFNEAIINHIEKTTAWSLYYLMSDRFKNYTIKERLCLTIYDKGLYTELSNINFENNSIITIFPESEDKTSKYIKFTNIDIPQEYKSYFISYEKLNKTLLYSGKYIKNKEDDKYGLFYSDSLNYKDNINLNIDVDYQNNEIQSVKYNVADSIEDGNEGKSSNLQLLFNNIVEDGYMSLYKKPSLLYDDQNKTLLRVSEITTNPYVNVTTYGFKSTISPIIIKDKYRINSANVLIKYDSTSDKLSELPFLNVDKFEEFSYIPDNYKQLNNSPKLYKTITNDVKYDEPTAKFYDSYLFLPQDTIDLFKHNVLDYDESILSIYQNYNKNNINQTNFVKTIRRSTYIKDESLENGWRSFESEAYQNIQENKGEITRIDGIGDLLLVHTKHSLFQFDKSNLISANNKNLQIAQADTFDVGYKEIFTSLNGYGGLQDKDAAIVGEFGYIWYNNDFNKIYQYDSGSLNVISGNIEFLLNKYKPTTCRFVDDKQNKRLIIQFQLKPVIVDGIERTQVLNLTYNYDTKSFISFYINDLSDPNTLNETYNTKTKFYILEHSVLFDKFDKCNAKKLSFIINENYSKIKRLNFIKYKMYKRIDSSNDKFDANLPVEGKAMSLATGVTPYSGFQLRVYNDLCDTGILDIYHDIKIGTSDKVKPYYDLGNFTFNNLRDKDNKNQIFGNFFIVEFIFEPKIDQEDGVIEFESLEYSVSYEEN